MNIEDNRLRSFDIWPANVPVDTHQLARCGFYATGCFLEAECFWCHRKICEWQQQGTDDQIVQRHRPACAFIANYTSCGNVPIGSYLDQQVATTSNVPAVSANPVPVQTQTVQLPIDLLVEANRLATFKNWPNPNISPQSLAKAGFFYLNRSDEVKCAWCKGVIAKWEKQDNAFEEHQRFFPDCPRVQLGPLIEIASEGIRDLGIQQISPPKKPKFSSLDARLRTYTNWPISEIQRPEELATAGLYYQDVGDQVRCFHCSIGLRSWQKEDDPWFEHAKWYPQCPFVRLVKGLNYVQDVLRKSAQQPPLATDCPAMSIDEAMTTPPVRQALEIGIDGGSIRNATQRQLLTSGRPYDTVEDLVKAVFGDREEEPTTHHDIARDSGNGTGVSIVREFSRIIDNIFGATDGENVPSSSANATLAQAENDSCQGGDAMPSSTAMPVAAAAGEAGAVTTADTPYSATTAAATAVLNESLSTSPGRNLSLEEENRKLKDARLCKVCLDEEVGVVFLPCGHLVTCVQCAPGVNQCPMCRTAIKGFVRTYLS